MPELPEVETIRLGLEKYIVGKKIISVEVRLKKILQGETSKIVGAKFKKIRRFGKALSLDLDNGYSVAVHVKMTGQLIWVSRVSRAMGRQLPGKFTHVIFHLKGGTLYYNDIRQFGWVKIMSTPDVEQMPFVRELGPEPFKDLTLEKLGEIIRNKSVKIKILLMDQKKIGGVGNIYANDALFLAGIDPRRPAKSLSVAETKKLYQSIIEVLKRGLKYGGSSENTYVNALGEKGNYQDHSLVYGKAAKHAKAGKICKVCGGKITFARLGGRGTFFCEKCQK